MKFQGRTATAIILFAEDQILLIKRTTPPFVGFWALPGGRSEPSEKVEQTVVRETREETGLDVKIVGKVGEYHEVGEQGGHEYDYNAVCFQVEKVGGEIRKQKGEVSEIRLFALDQLPEQLAFLHAQMIKDFVSRKNTRADLAS